MYTELHKTIISLSKNCREPLGEDYLHDSKMSL